MTDRSNRCHLSDLHAVLFPMELHDLRQHLDVQLKSVNIKISLVELGDFIRDISIASICQVQKDLLDATSYSGVTLIKAPIEFTAQNVDSLKVLGMAHVLS